MSDIANIYSFKWGRVSTCIDHLIKEHKGNKEIFILPDETFHFKVNPKGNRLIIARDGLKLPVQMPNRIFATISLDYYNLRHGHVILIEVFLNWNGVVVYDPVNKRSITNKAAVSNVMRELRRLIKLKYQKESVYIRISVKTTSYYEGCCETMMLVTLMRRISSKCPPKIELVIDEVMRSSQQKLSYKMAKYLAYRRIINDFSEARKLVAKVNNLSVAALCRQD